MEKSKSFSGCYSSNYKEVQLGFEDRSKSYSFNGPVSYGKADDLSSTSGNPELERRKRVASYNMYATEGKFKSSFRNSFKWIKSKFVDTFYDDSSSKYKCCCGAA